MKRIICIIVLLFLSGCITSKEFWHKDNRIRVRPSIKKPDYENSPELDCARYRFMELWYAEVSSKIIKPTKPR